MISNDTLLITNSLHCLLIVCLDPRPPSVSGPGRGLNTHAYTHSVSKGHHVFLNLLTLKFYCLPDQYEIIGGWCGRRSRAPRARDPGTTAMLNREDLAQFVFVFEFEFQVFLVQNECPNQNQCLKLS